MDIFNVQRTYSFDQEVRHSDGINRSWFVLWHVSYLSVGQSVHHNLDSSSSGLVQPVVSLRCLQFRVSICGSHLMVHFTLSDSCKPK